MSTSDECERRVRVIRGAKKAIRGEFGSLCRTWLGVKNIFVDVIDVWYIRLKRYLLLLLCLSFVASWWKANTYGVDVVVGM